MLSRINRTSYTTLLDAATLQPDTPDATAIVYVETDAEPIIVTHADFQYEIQRYATALTKMGVKPRDLVILAHTQNLESIFGFWGALLIGAVPSMFPTLTEKLDRNIYMQNMAELVQLSDVRAILTTDAFQPELEQRVSCPVYGSEQLKASIDDASAVTPYHPQADTIAFLQHSSGTTGLQKGVALAHDAVLNQLASYSDSLQLNQDDVIVSWLPLYHDMGLIAGFLMPLIQGVPLVLMSPFDWVKRPALLFRAIHDYRGTLCWLPNFAYNHSARRIRQRDLEGLDVSSMRAFINCSEPVSAESHTLFADRFAQIGVAPEMLTVSYAMAENVFAVTQTPIGELPTTDVIDNLALTEQRQAITVAPDAANAIIKVSCGKPITGTKVKVVDDRGNDLPERHIGQLLIKSDCMLTEYYQRPDLNPFNADGWYDSGDKGYIAAGEIYVIGRSKDLIINAGKNVYPQDLEAIANTVSGVYPGRAVVFGVYDEKEGTELIALVAEVTTEDADERKRTSAQLRQTIVQQTTVTLSYVYLVSDKWLIKTSSGKIARNANRDKWLAERRSR